LSADIRSNLIAFVERRGAVEPQFLIVGKL
jgi:hypothetical protein